MIQLLNLGFVKMPDGTYMNYEFDVQVRVVDREHVEIVFETGPTKVTLAELEQAILNGGDI
jgi:hypothetical protein